MRRRRTSEAISSLMHLEKRTEGSTAEKLPFHAVFSFTRVRLRLTRTALQHPTAKGRYVCQNALTLKGECAPACRTFARCLCTTYPQRPVLHNHARKLLIAAPAAKRRSRLGRGDMAGWRRTPRRRPPIAFYGIAIRRKYRPFVGKRLTGVKL